jgi:nucleoside-diphosphate-sugar epimerase
MKVLAIGSEGNIGGPLVEYLRTQGQEVYSTDIKPGYRPEYAMADINHPVDLLDAFDWGPDVVYLMAAVVSRVTCEQAGSLAVATNIGGVNNIVQLVKRAGAKLIYFSTSEVYGPTEKLMDEDVSIPRPNNRYGLTKYLGEQIVDYEVRTHGLEAVTVRPFMFYDENEALGDHRSAMIRFAQGLAEGKPVEVHGGTSRSWMHISDAVRALYATMFVENYEVINIGHPDVVETTALAEMFRTRLGAPRSLLNIIEQPGRMTPTKVPALNKQRNLLGIVPTVDVEEGVARVAARFRPSA